MYEIHETSNKTAHFLHLGLNKFLGIFEGEGCNVKYF